jgi:hypothetical protein
MCLLKIHARQNLHDLFELPDPDPDLDPGSYYPECPAAPGGAYIACLGGSGERRAGVHPGAVPGRLVAGRGVAAHVGGAGGRPHRRTPPRSCRAQVRLYRVPVLLLTVNFAAKNARKVVFEVLTAGIFSSKFYFHTFF